MITNLVLSRIEAKLDRVIRLLEISFYLETSMAQELEALQAQVAANDEVEASAVLLIQGIAAKLDAAKTDPAKLSALSASLKSSADALAASVAANTDASPPADTVSGT